MVTLTVALFIVLIMMRRMCVTLVTLTVALFIALIMMRRMCVCFHVLLAVLVKDPG